VSSEPVRDPHAQPPLSTLRTDYHARLDGIDDRLVGGALLVAEAMPGLVRCLLTADHSCLGAARALSGEVHERCRQVEEDGFLLIARQGPVSGDLRRLVSLLRLVHDVERAGRLARHIAEGVERLQVPDLPEPVRRQLEELAALSIEVFRRGLDAWRGRDALAVHELDRRDTQVDTLRTRLLVLAGELERPPAEVVALGLVGRYLERLADHGMAFAQQATFAVTGERVDVGR